MRMRYPLAVLDLPVKTHLKSLGEIPNLTQHLILNSQSLMRIKPTPQQYKKNLKNASQITSFLLPHDQKAGLISPLNPRFKIKNPLKPQRGKSHLKYLFNIPNRIQLNIRPQIVVHLLGDHQDRQNLTLNIY